MRRGKALVMSRSSRSDRHFLIDSLAAIGGLIGLYIAAQNVKSIPKCSVSAHHPAHATAATLSHLTNACLGQSVTNGFVAYVVPTVIGIFAGLFLAGVILSLHRLVSRS